MKICIQVYSLHYSYTIYVTNPSPEVLSIVKMPTLPILLDDRLPNTHILADNFVIGSTLGSLEHGCGGLGHTGILALPEIFELLAQLGLTPSRRPEVE